MQYISKSITATELKKMIDSGYLHQYLMIDLREKYQYNAGHIPGAVNIEYDTFMNMGQYDKLLQSGKDIILYCERGGSSVYATKRLFQYGVKTGKQPQMGVNKGNKGRQQVNIYSLSGGMTGYVKKFGK